MSKQTYRVNRVVRYVHDESTLVEATSAEEALAIAKTQETRLDWRGGGELHPDGAIILDDVLYATTK